MPPMYVRITPELGERPRVKSSVLYETTLLLIVTRSGGWSSAVGSGETFTTTVNGGAAVADRQKCQFSGLGFNFAEFDNYGSMTVLDFELRPTRSNAFYGSTRSRNKESLPWDSSAAAPATQASCSLVCGPLGCDSS